MRLATLKRGGRDGTLVVVSTEGLRVIAVPGWPTLQAALDGWRMAFPALVEASALLSLRELARLSHLAPSPRPCHGPGSGSMHRHFPCTVR